MKKLIALLIIIAILVGVKLLFFNNKEEQKLMTKTGVGIVPVSVNVFVPEYKKIENTFFVTGTVFANDEVELVSEISGKISKLNIVEGSEVPQGELLVKINDSDLQAQIKKLKTQEQLARDKEGRQKKLLDISGISQEEYENSLNILESIRADIEYTQSQISKTELRAPFTGIVGLKYVSEGTYVSPSVKIAAIQQIDQVKIDFSVPEKYSSLLSKGDSIRFSVEGNEEIYEAKIIAIEPKIDIATRTIKARAICPNAHNKILPGSFAKIEILLKEKEKSLMIPTEALVPTLKGYKVFIYRNGIAEESEVIAGLRTEDLVQALKGLQEGDTVITTGIMRLRNGSPVTISSVN